MKIIHVSFSILILFISCVPENETGSCSQGIPVSNKIEQPLFDQAFEEAKRQVYLWNISSGDIATDYYNREFSDSFKISSLDLIFQEHEWNIDTLTFYFEFERGLVPRNGPYFYSYSTWFVEGSYGMNYYDRIQYLNPPFDRLDTLKSYLRMRGDSLAPWLKCNLADVLSGDSVDE